MKVMTEHGLTSDYAQIVCVDNEDLDKIVKNPELLHDFGFIMSVLDKDCNNAVIIRLELKSRKNIIKYAEELLQTFDSVSWFHKGKFYIRRRV